MNFIKISMKVKIFDPGYIKICVAKRKIGMAAFISMEIAVQTTSE